MNKQSGVLATIPSAAVFDHWERRIEDIDAAETWKAMGLFQQWDKWLSHAQTDLRFRLGQLLAVVQRRKLFLEMGSHTWHDFLNDKAPEVTGLQRTVLYQALRIAGCESLIRLSPEERAAIPITNASTIAALEISNGKPVEPKIIENAAKMETNDFRQSVGASNGFSVKVWVKDKQQVGHLKRILDILRGCSGDTLEIFADVLHNVEVRAEAGDGPDNIIMHIHGHYLHSWQKELDERKAEDERVRNPNILDAEFSE